MVSQSIEPVSKIVETDIIKNRRETYGNNFPIITDLWIVYLKKRFGVELGLTSEDVSVMMGLMKVSRLAQSPKNEDSLVDMINYMWIGLNHQDYLSGKEKEITL